MLDAYIGQRDALAPLLIAIESSRATKRPLPHSLFLGRPGTGKTALARAVAQELGGPFIALNAATVKDADTIAQAALQTVGGVLFLDEIHALDRKQAESLFTLLDEASVTVQAPIMGTGWEYAEITKPEDHPRGPEYFYGPGLYEVPVQVPTKQTQPVQMIVGDVTVIGATTDESWLPPALLSRLSRLVVRLRPYTISELAQIADDYANALDCRIDGAAAVLLAQRARQSPRRVKHLTERAADYALVRRAVSGEGAVIIEDDAESALADAHIDRFGLQEPHREMLSVLVESGGLSRTSLAQRLGIPARNVELYWADLMQHGFVTIGRRHEPTEEGRVALAAMAGPTT